jgi:DNA-binding CsgD family transcriptional regulator
VRTTAEALTRDARARGIGYIVAMCDQAVALLELGLGNYAAASLRTPETLDHDPAFGPMRAADSVEAHARGGDREVAAGLVDWLARRAEATRHPYDLGLSARTRALMSDDSHAESQYLESNAQLKGTTAALQLARTQLLYGEWLRRQNRRRDARGQLSAAHETFEAAGAGAFEQRARTELLATGARARKRTDDTRRDLTPQEEQIARLAAQGATNPEIGARLFISPSTVDYHLRKVYAKLEITSRRQLIHTRYGEPEASS